MFKKLLGNLPFNPSLIGQVSFYAKRMHHETSIRRTGFIILALAVAIQTFAIVSPPQTSVANSNNDLVNGGFANKSEAVSICKQNARGYKTIMYTYGITCDALDAATTVTIKSTDNDKRLYSMGHLAYGKKGETPIDISGVGTVYMRYLWSWDSAGASSYKALKVKSSDNKTYYVLYDCGNLVSIGLPTAIKKVVTPVKTPVKIPTTCANNSTLPDCAKPCEYNSLISATSSDCKPCTASQTHTDLTACLEYHKVVANLTQSKLDANGTTAKAGDKLRYTLTTTNHGKATIRSYIVTENVSDVLDYSDIISLNKATKNEGNILTWPASDIKAGAVLTQTFDVQIKNPIPSTPISSSDPGHYDLTMTNAYGNTTNIKLPQSVVKTTELAATTLPNTGPGTSIVIAATLTTVVGYLFARSRLIAKELDIVRTDYGSTGGNA